MKSQRMEMSFGKCSAKISTKICCEENNLNRKRLSSGLNSFASTHPTLLSKWKITKVFITEKVTYIHCTYMDISKGFTCYKSYFMKT